MSFCRKVWVPNNQIVIHNLSFSVNISCLANIDLHVRLQTLWLYFPKLFNNCNHRQQLTGNFSSIHKLIFANLTLNYKSFMIQFHIQNCRLVWSLGHIILLPLHLVLWLLHSLIVSHCFKVYFLCVFGRNADLPSPFSPVSFSFDSLAKHLLIC